MAVSPLITAADLKNRFDIDTEIDAKRLDPNIGAASRRLRKWVGDAAYADAAADTPADEDRAEDMKNAEAHLAMHFAILGFNSPISAKGVVATAMSSEAKELRKYLAPKETAEVAQAYLDLAKEIAGPYMTDSGTPAPPFEVVGSGDDCVIDTKCEAVTRC